MGVVDLDKLIISFYNVKDKRLTFLQGVSQALAEQGLKCEDGKLLPINSKFNVGDWILYREGEAVPMQILEVSDEHYTMSDGKKYLIGTIDEMPYSLWSVEDAKAGDILYTPKGAGVEGIFLISGWKNVENTGRTLCSNVGYSIDDDEVVVGGLGAIWWKGVIDPFYPATQEQRETLLSKMHEAGYGYDEKSRKVLKYGKRKWKDEKLNDFDSALFDIIRKVTYKTEMPMNGEILDLVEANSERLMALACKQKDSEKRLGVTHEEFQKELQTLYKYADEVQYQRGYDKGYEDAKKENVPIPHIPSPLVGEYEEVASSDLHEQTKRMLALALERNGGDRKETAKELGISERTLYRRIKQFGLD